MGPTLNLKQAIRKWWILAGNTRLKLVFQVVSYSNFVIFMEEKEQDFTWKLLFYCEGGLEYVNDIVLKVIKIRSKGKSEVNNRS